jgi:hypothetical protein
MQRNRNTSRGRKSTGQSRPWSSRPSFGTSWASALGLIGGAGIGAALMYMLDPDEGFRRRHHLIELGESAFSSSADAVTGAFRSAAHRAGDVIGSIPSALPHMPSAGDVRESASGLMESAKARLPYRLVSRHSTDVPLECAAMTAGAAVLLGLGAMWLFDPNRGRGRRAWIGQKATHAAHKTGDYMSSTGRHLRNKAKGYYHEATGAVRDLAGQADQPQTVSPAGTESI